MKKLLPFVLFFWSVAGYAQTSCATTITAFRQPTDIYVPAGTAFGSINFSDYSKDRVSARYYDGSIGDVLVTWSSSGYSTSAGNYVITGTPLAVTNQSANTPTVTVHVVTLETEYQAVLTEAATQGYTAPTPINQGHQNRYAKYLKDNNAFTTKERLGVWCTDGSSDFARINWINPAGTKFTLVNSPSYTSRVGFTGNGTNSYVNTNFNTSTATLFTQNSGSYMVYVYSQPTTGVIVGNVGASSRNQFSQSGGRTSTLSVNDPTVASPANSFGPGLYQAYRQSSTQTSLYKNGGFLQQGAGGTSAARANNNIYVLARNNSGTADSFCDVTVSLFSIGAEESANTIINNQGWMDYFLETRPKNTYAAPADLGTIVDDTFARATLGSKYEVIAGTWTMTGTQINVTDGTGSVRRVLNYINGSSSEDCTILSRVQLNQAPSATTFAPAPTFKDYSNPDPELTIATWLDLSTGTDAGKLKVFTDDGTTITQVAIGSSGFTGIANGDIYNITVRKHFNGTGDLVFDVNATREGDGATVPTLTYARYSGGWMFDASMHEGQGNFNIKRFKFDIADNKNSDLYVCGNSLTYGSLTTHPGVDGWAHRITSNVVVGGDPGGYTDSGLDRQLNMSQLACRYYIYILAGNDEANGIANATWQNKALITINGIKYQGHRVIAMCPFPRNDGDMNEVRLWMQSLTGVIFTDDAYWMNRDPITGGLRSSSDFGDGVHLNDAASGPAAEIEKGEIGPLY